MSDVLSELEMVRAAHDGLLRPGDVVDYARDPNTALHAQFEWDDTEAAEQYRRWQAREIIRVAVTVVDPGPQEAVRMFVSLKSDRTKPGGGYRAMVAVLSDEQMRHQMLVEALDELHGLRSKYKALQELGRVWAAVDAINVGNEAAAA